MSATIVVTLGLSENSGIRIFMKNSTVQKTQAYQLSQWFQLFCIFYMSESTITTINILSWDNKQLLKIWARTLYSNSSFTRLIKNSIETGFLKKHPILNVGYCSLNASWFMGPEDMKQTRGLAFKSKIFTNSNTIQYRHMTINKH